MNVNTRLVTLLLCCLEGAAIGHCADTQKLVADSNSREIEAQDDFRRGTNYCRIRDWDNAIETLTKAIIAAPEHASAYAYRGTAFFSKGQLDNALNDFSRVIQLEPTNSNALFNRASVYRIKSDFRRSLEDLAACLRLNPTDDLAYKTRASIRNSLAQFNQAISDCTEGLKINPNDPSALVMRGYSYSMTSRFTNALADYHQAIRPNPNFEKAHNELAWLLATCPDVAIRNGKEAVYAATKACELTNWAKWENIDTLAAAYAESGNFEKAVEYEKQAMDMQSVSGEDRKEMKRHLSMYEHHEPNHEGKWE